MQILAQVLGVAGMAVGILSFQCRKNSLLFWGLGISGLLFSVHYFLLGAFTGALINVINVVRSIWLVTPRLKHWGFMVGMNLLYCAAILITYNGWLSILILLTQLAGTFAMWQNNGKTIRVVQFFVISPIWLMHNIIVFSVGGIICEIFNLCSILVSFIRFRKTGFEQSSRTVS